MKELDALRIAIDIATKHGKHNQRLHGRRFGPDTGGGAGGGAESRLPGSGATGAGWDGTGPQNVWDVMDRKEKEIRAMTGKEAASRVEFEAAAGRSAVRNYEEAVDDYSRALSRARRRADAAPDEESRKRAHAEIDKVDSEQGRLDLSNNKMTVDSTKNKLGELERRMKYIERSPDLTESHYKDKPDDYTVRRAAAVGAESGIIRRMAKDIEGRRVLLDSLADF